MAQQPTTVTIFTPDQWAQRLLQLYPNKWSGDSAKLAGGILYSLFEAMSTGYTTIQTSLDWALNACRIATAEDVALDAIATDYFGTVAQFEATVVRQPGESDGSFRSRIYANLMQSGGTRGDISRVVELLTGQPPRIIEPWNILDCGACDSISYCDIDTPENPCLVGDTGGMPFQMFVESILPPFGGNANNPVWCIDDGLACDRSFIIDPQPTWFLGQQQLDLAINRVRMFGTIVWRSYQSTLSANYERGNSPYPGANTDNVSVSLSPPCPGALVVLACATWNSSVSVSTFGSTGNFSINLGTQAPGGQCVDWIAAPATYPGYGLLYLEPNSTTAALAIPSTSEVLLVTPNWNTNVWVTSMEGSSANFEFSSASPPGGLLNYGSFDVDHSGIIQVSAGNLVSNAFFNTPINNPYQLILLPGWNTQFETQKSNGGFTVTFSEPPPASGSFFYWGVLDQPL